MCRSASCEIYLVTTHTNLEFDSVLSSHDTVVLLIVVKEAVNLSLWNSPGGPNAEPLIVPLPLLRTPTL
jgi:hypothetical protein